MYYVMIPRYTREKLTKTDLKTYTNKHGFIYCIGNVLQTVTAVTAGITEVIVTIYFTGKIP